MILPDLVFGRPEAANTTSTLCAPKTYSAAHANREAGLVFVVCDRNGTCCVYLTHCDVGVCYQQKNLDALYTTNTDQNHRLSSQSLF